MGRPGGRATSPLWSRASSASIAATAADSGPSCPESAIVPIRTLRRTSSSGSPSSAATAAANSSASGSARRIAVQRSSVRSMGILGSRLAASLWAVLRGSLQSRHTPFFSVGSMTLTTPNRTISRAPHERLGLAFPLAIVSVRQEVRNGIARKAREAAARSRRTGDCCLAPGAPRRAQGHQGDRPRHRRAALVGRSCSCQGSARGWSVSRSCGLDPLAIDQAN